MAGDYGFSTTFTIVDLSPYLDDDYLEDLRAYSSSQGENDGGLSLLASYGPNKSKGNWKDAMFQAQETITG